MRKTYTELLKYDSFEDRIKYLICNGVVGEFTFNGHRHLNQVLYTSPEWRRTRRDVIVRDHACDLAFPGYELDGNIIVHHINPITIEDVLERNPVIFNLENLVSCSKGTHKRIHYGNDENNLFSSREPIIRTKGDTCLWK